jgi:hypothetical protein
MNKNKNKNKNMVVIGIAVVAVSVAIAFGVFEMLRPKRETGICTSIAPLSDTNPIRQKCENIQEKDLCHEAYDKNSNSKLCQWRS